MMHINEKEPTAMEIIKPLIPRVVLPTFFLLIGQGIAWVTMPMFVLSVLGDPRYMVGVVGACKSFGQLLANTPAAHIVERYGLRTSMLVGLTLHPIASVLMYFAPNVWVFLLLVIAKGAALSLYVVGRQTYTTIKVPNKHRGKATSVQQGGQRAANFLGPALAGLLLTRLSVRQLFFVQSAAVLPAIALTLFAVRITPEEQAEVTQKKGTGGGAPKGGGCLSTMWSYRKDFATAGTFMYLYSVVRETMQIILPMLAYDEGFSSSKVAFVLSTMFLMEVGLFWVAGWVMDKHGRKYSGVPTALLMAVGYSVLAYGDRWGLMSPAAVLFVSAVLFGVGNGASTGICMVIGGDIAKTLDRKAQFQAAYRMVGNAGQMTGPLLAGLVGHVSLTACAALFAGLSLLTSLWMVLFVPETLHRDVEEDVPLLNTTQQTNP